MDRWNCIISCNGVYADVNFFNDSRNENAKRLLEKIKMAYLDLKRNFSLNIQFDQNFDQGSL